MGSDIHGFYQVKRKGDDAANWLDQDEIENGRNYELFALLGNVRNGYGFGGFKTHDEIKPIVFPLRGLPSDVELDGENYDVWGREVWMGDHSYNYLTFDEIEAYPHWDDKLQETGYITREEYAVWDGKQPEWWSSMLMGGSIVLSEDGVTPEGWTHARVNWNDRTLRDKCAVFLKWMEYIRCKEGDCDIRIVFGFDN